MSEKEVKLRLLGKQVWCVDCCIKRPPIIRKAAFLIPARKKHYDLLPDKSGIDNRVIGICEECLKDRSKFQRDNTEPVDVNHKNMVYSNIFT